MADTAEGPAAAEVQKGTSETLVNIVETKQTKHTVTVVKSSETERLQTRQTVLVDGHQTEAVNGVRDASPEGYRSATEQTAPEVKENVTIVPEVHEQVTASGDDEGGNEEIDLRDVKDDENAEEDAGEVAIKEYDSDKEERVWVPRPLTQEEIDSVIDEYAHMPQENLERCLDFFWSVDLKRHGYFTAGQFSRAMKARRKKITEAQIVRMFTDIDLDHDLVVSLPDFLGAMSKKRVHELRSEDVRPLFEEMDGNQDGFICEHDLRVWMDAHPPALHGEDKIRTALSRDIARTSDKRIDLDGLMKIVKLYWQR